MSKKRKTKREKVLAELRKQINKTKDPQPITLNSNTITYQDTINQTKETTKIKSYLNQTHTSKNYSYVLNDVRKTLFITFFIAIANSAVFLLFEKNILSFKSLGF